MVTASKLGLSSFACVLSMNNGRLKKKSRLPRIVTLGLTDNEGRRRYCATNIVRLTDGLRKVSNIVARRWMDTSIREMVHLASDLPGL